MTKGNGGEKAWKWIVRLCALVGFGFCVWKWGTNTRPEFIVLLIGLFFGPDFMKKGGVKVTLDKDTEDDAA
jgi:hypothetical protein